jgi:phosphotransferase system  glucose/maltose/N-acetylglucosamine-specific IIC component
LTVPTSSIWAAVPFLLAIIVAIFAGSHVVAGVALLIGFLLMCWIDYKYVPTESEAMTVFAITARECASDDPMKATP